MDPKLALALSGKKIEDAYYREDDGQLVLEFEDGSRLLVSADMTLNLVIHLEQE